MSWQVRVGDCRALMREMLADSVHCVVTSPPYFGLRDYSVDTWQGGDPDCDHSTGRGSNVPQTKHPNADAYPASAGHRGGGGGVCARCGAVRVGQVWGGSDSCEHEWGEPLPPRPGRGNRPGDVSTSSLTNPERQDEAPRPQSAGQWCQLCGAWRGSLGLEPTLDQYVANLVEVFREVRRVLRPDGVAWLVLGDSYASASTYNTTNSVNSEHGWKQDGPRRPNVRASDVGLKAKDRIGVPHEVVRALRDDGWWWRDEIVWSKTSPMPSSVRDRCTPSHEFAFMLTKRARYFFDQEAIREPFAAPEGPWGGRNPRPGVDVNGGNQALDTDEAPREYLTHGGRNKRSVWTVGPEPFAEAHFATFPAKLIRPMILAGSPPKCCGECGAPWERVTERSTRYESHAARAGRDPDEIRSTGKWQSGELALGRSSGNANVKAGPIIDVTTLGWHPTCEHDDEFTPGDFDLIETPTGERAGDDPSRQTGRAGMNRPRHPEEGRRLITRYEQRRYAEQLRVAPTRSAMEAEAGPAFAHYIRTDPSGARPVPPGLLERWIEAGHISRVEPPRRREPDDSGRAVVLDPFSGAGTTLLVAAQLGRDSIGCELNPEYAELARERITRWEANPEGLLEGDPEPMEGQEALW